MNNSRRNFIKKSLLGLAGLLVLPKISTSEIKAEPSIKLQFKPSPETWDSNNISLSWLGHSTVLINFYGKILLTDPALFNRVGVNLLGLTIGPERLTPPALSIDEIPKPDLILLSHGHMDHTDYPTLEYLTEKFPNQIDVVTAYLTKDIIEDLEWKSIAVLDWSDSANISDINITAFEVKHFGWRYPWEKDRSRGYYKDGRSFNSYLIEYNNKKIFFGGDTAYTDKLTAVAPFAPDIAIMPVGAYNPWKHNHCNPEEALKMAKDMNAKHFIPIHTKTFIQSQEPFNEAIEWTRNSYSNYNLNLGLSSIGETFVL